MNKLPKNLSKEDKAIVLALRQLKKKGKTCCYEEVNKRAKQIEKCIKLI